jgi:hypothetical protein
MSELAPAPHDTCYTHRIYYLSCEEYLDLWEFAQGQCQICGIAPEDTPRGKLCIDHHGPYGFGMVRGLLCDKCNTLMRYVDDGTAKWSPAVHDYRVNAWFARQIMFGRGFTVDRSRFRPRWKWPEPQMPEGETA